MIAGLIALLVGRGVAGWVAGLIVYGVLAAIVIGGTATIWHVYVAKPYYTRGVTDGKAEQKKIDDPIIDKQVKRADLAERRLAIALDANRQLTEDIEGPDGLRAQTQQSAETIERLARLANEARATAKRLLAEIAERSKRDAAEIERLRTAAAGPPVDFDAACREADRVLSDLAIWVRS